MNKRKILTIILFVFMCVGYSASKDQSSKASQLQLRLEEFVTEKDARIGIAVIIDGKDTVTVNGRRDFPMMSVVKFPQAIALAKWLEDNNKTLADSVTFDASDLMENTYSPMLRKYGRITMTMSFRELLGWSLINSDNNACDIIFRHLGGVENTESLLHRMKISADITIGATEADMYEDKNLSYLNRSTPLAMAELFSRFDNRLRHLSSDYADIALMLEQCQTGQDRLAAPLMQTNAVIGHKTGTGFVMPQGRLMSVNDCGYVCLPNGHKYVIAVFIADSGYDLDTTSGLIADISEIVYSNILKQ